MVSKDMFERDFKEKITAVRKALREEKVFRLKELANECIKEAVVRNDSSWADLSIVSYSFYKLLTKKHIKHSSAWEASKRQMIKSLDECIEGTRDFDVSKCKIHYQQIVKRISSIDQKLGHYVQNTYGKSRIKMASSAYAFGASLAKASFSMTILIGALIAALAKGFVRDWWERMQFLIPSGLIVGEALIGLLVIVLSL